MSSRSPATADPAAIREAVQAILGDTPKSSLLFGAPAISLKQLEATLAIPQNTLFAAEVLPIAAQVAADTFMGRRHASLKNLMRGGQQEEWIVFRPILPGAELRPPPPRPAAHTASNSQTKAGNQPETVVNLSLELIEEKKEKSSLARNFLRPFFKSKTPKDEAKDTTELANYSQQEFKLPPAHLIGSDDFGALLVPMARPIPLSTLQPSERKIFGGETHVGSAGDLETVPRPTSALGPKHRPIPPSRQPARSTVDTKAGMATTTREERLARLSHPAVLHPPKIQNENARHLPTERASQGHVPVTVEIVVDFSISSLDTDSSLPYLSKKQKVDPEQSRPGDVNFDSRALVAAEARSSEGVKHVISKSKRQDPSSTRRRVRPSPVDIKTTVASPSRSTRLIGPPTKKQSESIVRPVVHSTLPPSTLIVTLSPSTTASNLRFHSPPGSPIAPFSQLTPVSPSSSLTSRSPSSPISPIASAPPTPWLDVAFQDLPFGPDVRVADSQILDWVKMRWQILGAELVVIVGAVYIFQVVGT